jgi:hypothetical protein
MKAKWNVDICLDIEGRSLCRVEKLVTDKLKPVVGLVNRIGFMSSPIYKAKNTTPS